ncbi:hypothetical protein Dsin_022885 [Dipteronia sinensis]|uniref:RNase H type-1 domain-containing protein n=1 Tax=Dipteronia sinensis TaxID=43782 RepID=A0AAE0A2D8_9ROSI|nr:hypothetical protein Dsin_022885 [Dipteronia sinensis]
MCFGVGATIRDDKGRVLAARSNQLAGSFSNEVGHFLALREGLQLAKFYNLHVSIAETSSSGVGSLLSCSVPIFRKVNFIVNDIKALFSEVGVCKCQAIPR